MKSPTFQIWCCRFKVQLRNTEYGIIMMTLNDWSQYDQAYGVVPQKCLKYASTGGLLVVT